MLYHGSVRRVHNKECCFIITYIFLGFSWTCMLRECFHAQSLVTYIFSVSLKFGACYISQWGELRVKNATLCLHLFFGIVSCCFSSRNWCFYHFHVFFWWTIKFSQQNINQSELGISNKKLSVELYGELQLSWRNCTILFVR